MGEGEFMVVTSGAKLLVCHRRLFSEDQPRFFAGVVQACDGNLAKVSGYSWSRDPGRGFQRKEDLRTKLIALGSGSVIVYELPTGVAIEDLHIEQPGGHALVMTDGKRFHMDLAERMPAR